MQIGLGKTELNRELKRFGPVVMSVGLTHGSEKFKLNQFCLLLVLVVSLTELSRI